MLIKIYRAAKILPVLPVVFFIAATPVSAAFSLTNISPVEISTPDQIITLEASASGLSEKTQYLQAAITKAGDNPNYFGFTQNNKGDFISYKSSPDFSEFSQNFFEFTPTEGSWSGKLLAKIDPADSGFIGSGNYLVKIIRYITSSSGNSSNSLNLTISYSVPPPPPEPEPPPLPPPPPSAPFVPPAAKPVTPKAVVVSKPASPSSKIASAAAVLVTTPEDEIPATPESLLSTTLAPKEKVLAAETQKKNFPIIPVFIGLVGAILTAASLGLLLFRRKLP